MNSAITTKHNRNWIGLVLGCVWGAIVIFAMCKSTSCELIGEGPYYYLVAATPLAVIAVVHSINISLPSFIPVIYGLVTGALLIGMTIPYRIVFPSGNTTKANLLLILCFIAITIICTLVFYIVPVMKMFVRKIVIRSNKNKN